MMKSNTKSFDFEYCSLTETQSIISNLILDDNRFISKVLSNDRKGPMHIKYQSESRTLRYRWLVFKLCFWYFSHTYSLYKELKKLRDVYLEHLDSLTVADMILYKIFEQFYKLVYIVRGANQNGVTLEMSTQMRKEYDTLNNDSKIYLSTRSFYAPKDDKILHLINSGSLPEVKDKEGEVTHIEVTVHNSKGDSFVLGVLKKK